MRRPGPRPYECVRRAWHSDRHQPIRGSLIKEIFRVANEIHSSSTKQNKEWQEKLPTVVLKAEEIMYSKANSEAEYMDLKTLWDRTNDAINTIIRHDESETGQFLQPCIEAALNLGCTPRRASRSQRNCHPRFYLNSNATENDHASADCPNFVLPRSCLGSDPRRYPLAQNTIAAAVKLPSVPKSVPPSNYTTTKSHSAYPLFYGNIPNPGFEQLNRGFVIPPNTGSYIPEPVKGKMVPQDSSVSIRSDLSRISFDLSLRLGPLSVTDPAPSSIENKQTPEVKKGFSLFHRGNTSNSLGSFKNVDSESNVRKRKAGFDQTTMEDQQFCFQPKLPFRHVTGL